MNDLSAEESQEHARLWAEYVRAVERHKTLLPAAVATVAGNGKAKTATALEDNYIHLVWQADARLEMARQALDQFRSAREIG